MAWEVDDQCDTSTRSERTDEDDVTCAMNMPRPATSHCFNVYVHEEVSRRIATVPQLAPEATRYMEFSHDFSSLPQQHHGVYYGGDCLY